MRNILIGTVSGLIPGWISSIASTVIMSEFIDKELYATVVVAAISGWGFGMIGGAISGSISDNTNVIRNGTIGGALLPVVLCGALVATQQRNYEEPSSTSSSS